jgi:integrase
LITWHMGKCQKATTKTMKPPRWHRHFLDYVYRPALAGMNIDYKSPKACRHTFANITHSLLDDKTRKEIMGHSDIRITNDIYTDIEDGKLLEAFGRVEKSLTKDKQKSNNTPKICLTKV